MTSDNGTIVSRTALGSYDAAGNLTSKVHNTTTETWLYYYNGDNQLVKAEHKPNSVSAVDKLVEFKYDVFGQKIERSYDADGPGGNPPTIEKYAYDHGNIWADLTAGGSLTTRRIFAGSQMLARIPTSGLEEWYLTDLRGSVTDILDSTGTLVLDHLKYDSFGQLLNESNPANGDRFKWTGREWDDFLKLQYNHWRWYDPATMRWTTQDPLGFGAGDTNLNRYVGNSSPNATDPSGLQQSNPRPAPTYDGRAQTYDEYRSRYDGTERDRPNDRPNGDILDCFVSCPCAKPRVESRSGAVV